MRMHQTSMPLARMRHQLVPSHHRHHPLTAKQPLYTDALTDASQSTVRGGT